MNNNPANSNTHPGHRTVIVPGRDKARMETRIAAERIDVTWVAHRMGRPTLENGYKPRVSNWKLLVHRDEDMEKILLAYQPGAGD
ncbi:hypothetical protein [Xanthomonas oryzae]|uniref:hypothetical protein n=1 Tax=Xanthomonas oryzae TaxID=347 RepID=UPI0010450A1A|nr:hypothetical protein [Xanthomonas oryzae]QBG92984.1 hypothetical protein EYR26_17435 [Xanthomonas oryzae]